MQLGVCSMFMVAPNNFCYLDTQAWWGKTVPRLISAFIGRGLGFWVKEDLVWYVLFIIFVPYAMLPLPLRWCMIAGCISSLTHIIILTVRVINANRNSAVSNGQVELFH